MAVEVVIEVRQPGALKELTSLPCDCGQLCPFAASCFALQQQHPPGHEQWPPRQQPQHGVFSDAGTCPACAPHSEAKLHVEPHWQFSQAQCKVGMLPQAISGINAQARPTLTPRRKILVIRLPIIQNATGCWAVRSCPILRIPLRGRNSYFRQSPLFSPFGCSRGPA